MFITPVRRWILFVVRILPQPTSKPFAQAKSLEITVDIHHSPSNFLYVSAQLWSAVPMQQFPNPSWPQSSHNCASVSGISRVHNEQLVIAPPLDAHKTATRRLLSFVEWLESYRRRIY